MTMGPRSKTRSRQLPLSKTQAAIISVLGLLGGRVHRTKLVKLVYLADERFYELTGETLTGVGYTWDNFGPNAISNAIVKEADKLVRSEKIQMATQQSMYGGDSFTYWASGESAAESMAHLGAGAGLVIRDTIQKYGHMGVSQIVAASKRSKPFEQAPQYSVLSMEEDEQAADLRRQVAGNPGLLEAARQGLQDLADGDVVSQEELDEQYSLRG